MARMWTRAAPAIFAALVLSSFLVAPCSAQGVSESYREGEPEWDEESDAFLQRLQAGEVDFNNKRLLVVPWKKSDGSWDWGEVEGARWAFRPQSNIDLLAGLARLAETEETVLGVLDLQDVDTRGAVALYKILKARKAFKEVIFDTRVSVDQSQSGSFFQPGDFPSPSTREFSSSAQRPVAEYQEFLAQAVAAFKSVVPVVPNDEHWDREWGSRKIRGDFAISREFPTQGEGTVVAVLDTGCVMDHDDLQPNLWTNEAELNGLEGVDDDGNGFVDDIYGYNFVSDSGDVADDNGHGSHVAGIVAAVVNNTFGVVGVAPRTKIMCLKFMDETGSGFISAAVQAMAYAIQMNATVQNHSWGAPGSSMALQRLAQLSGRLGQLVVAAAGNENVDTDKTPTFPAALSNTDIYGEVADYVVSVGATDEGDSRASFSNFGVETVDLSAPGVSILSLSKDRNKFTYKQGTSMACPMVAGAAAVVMSVVNQRIAGQDISNIITDSDKTRFAKKVLTESVDPVPMLQGFSRTAGRLNLYSSIQLAVTGEPDAIVHVQATQLDPKMEWWAILLIVLLCILAVAAGVALVYCFCSAARQRSQEDLYTDMVKQQAQAHGMQQHQNGYHAGPQPAV